MKFSATTLLGMLVLALNCPAAEMQPTMPLQGEWRFAMDREDVGVEEEWFNRELADRIRLPGILQARGYGDEISIDTPWVLSPYDKYWYLREDYQAYTNAGNVKVPFVSQLARHYLGVVYYQRDIVIPEDCAERRVEFTRTVEARHLRLTALSGFGDDPTAALAELAIVPAVEIVADGEGGPIEYHRVRSTSTDVEEGD